MKKISLKRLNLKEIEQLSREQLKNVLGGLTETLTTHTPGSMCTNNCPSGSVTFTCPSGQQCEARAGDGIYCDGFRVLRC